MLSKPKNYKYKFAPSTPRKIYTGKAKFTLIKSRKLKLCRMKDLKTERKIKF